MAKAAKAADQFMNFAGVESRTDAVDSTVAEETELRTGLSVRGKLIWLIHQVEWWPTVLTGNIDNIRMAISTRKGLGIVPALTDDGTVCIMENRMVGAAAAGLAEDDSPKKLTFLPPVPIASPTLSVYIASTQNHADAVDKLCAMRIGFTTSELDSAAYTEIVETWGW